MSSPNGVRRWVALLATASAAGTACQSVPPDPSVERWIRPADDSSRPPPLECPDGSRLIGLGPPEGLSARCARISGDGTLLNHGPSASWYPSGTLRKREHFESGERSGPAESWYADGTRKAERSYANGVQAGMARVWYPNAGLASEEEYDASGALTRRRTWDEGGAPRSEGSFEGDRRSGPWRFQYAGGRPCMEGAYVAGERDGSWVYHPLRGGEQRARFEAGRKVEGRDLPDPEICAR